MIPNQCTPILSTVSECWVWVGSYVLWAATQGAFGARALSKKVPHGLWHRFCLARVQPKETDIDMATLASRGPVPGCAHTVWASGENWREDSVIANSMAHPESMITIWGMALSSKH